MTSSWNARHAGVGNAVDPPRVSHRRLCRPIKRFEGFVGALRRSGRAANRTANSPIERAQAAAEVRAMRRADAAQIRIPRVPGQRNVRTGADRGLRSPSSSGRQRIDEARCGERVRRQMIQVQRVAATAEATRRIACATSRSGRGWTIRSR